MSYGSDGYGHDTGAFGGYGENVTGYGDPFDVLGAFVSAPDACPDDGGVLVTLGGSYASEGPYRVEVGGKVARAGVPGQSWRCYPGRNFDSLRFVCPPLAPGTYPIDLSWPGGSETIPASLVVLRRHRASCIYELRGMLPSKRRLGPRSIEDEALLTGAGEFP